MSKPLYYCPTCKAIADNKFGFKINGVPSCDHSYYEDGETVNEYVELLEYEAESDSIPNASESQCADGTYEAAMAAFHECLVPSLLMAAE
jgi:hypothetical protein